MPKHKISRNPMNSESYGLLRAPEIETYVSVPPVSGQPCSTRNLTAKIWIYPIENRFFSAPKSTRKWPTIFQFTSARENKCFNFEFTIAQCFNFAFTSARENKCFNFEFTSARENKCFNFEFTSARENKCFNFEITNANASVTVEFWIYQRPLAWLWDFEFTNAR
jgi:hypothetical protein